LRLRRNEADHLLLRQCEYASLHLPSFIEKGVLPNFLVNEHGDIFQQLLTILSTTDYFARWVRTQDGIGLLLVIVERLNANFPSISLKGLVSSIPLPDSPKMQNTSAYVH